METNNLLIKIKKTPNFSIFEKNKRVETLEHCFIEHMLLDIDNPQTSLIAKNGKLYQAVYDNIFIPEDRKPGTSIPCIVSFQKHSYGSFAVIRNFYSKNQN